MEEQAVGIDETMVVGTGDLDPRGGGRHEDEAPTARQDGAPLPADGRERAQAPGRGRTDLGVAVKAVHSARVSSVSRRF
jgi:hypothetical protein